MKYKNLMLLEINIKYHYRITSNRTPGWTFRKPLAKWRKFQALNDFH